MCVAQDAIDLGAKAVMLFDGENEAELNIETKLIDGFTYRIPFELRFKEDIALSDLQGETVCQCASLQFEATATRDQSSVAMGNIFLRPQAVDLVQTLRAFGNRSGDVEAVKIGRINVNCKVYSPVRFTPSLIEVVNHRFPVDTIELHVSNGVDVVDVSMSDSNAQIESKYENGSSLFRLKLNDSPLKEDQGELIAEFSIKYRGTVRKHTASIPYASKSSVRVVPSVVTFRQREKVFIGRLVVMGFGPSETTGPTLLLEKQVEAGDWEQTNVVFEMDQFGFGKAIGRLALPLDQSVIESGTRSKLRLVDKETRSVAAEFEAVLVR